ncbi:hypothetical protein ACH4TQ_12370 [Streptomyces sp. NPDC021218]
MRADLRLWITFTAYLDGIDVVAVGEIDDLLQAAEAGSDEQSRSA